MTKRRSLTPKERNAMYFDQGGLCKQCGKRLNLRLCIAEHWHPVALGNDQKPDCLLCKTCADRKTNGTPATTYGSDSHEIAKAKRLEAKRLGTASKRPKQKIATRGFPKPPEGYKHQWPKRKVGQ